MRKDSLPLTIPISLLKKDDKTVYIIETKGREEENDKLKFERLQKMV